MENRSTRRAIKPTVEELDKQEKGLWFGMVMIDRLMVIDFFKQLKMY